MNKYSTLLLAGAVALSFASCSKQDTSGVNPTGTATFASIKAQESSLRASTDGQNDAAGVGGESKIAKGVFYASQPSDVFGAKTTLLDFSEVVEGTETYWQTSVFKYTGTTGDGITSGLALNGLSAVSALDAAQTLGIDQLPGLAAATGFTMTSTANNSIDIKPDVDQTDVTAGNNQFDYVVERVVSKVQVTKSQSFDVALQGEVEDIRYAVAGSAKSVYYFRDNAGNRKLEESDPAVGYGAGFKSAINDLPASTYTETDFATRRDLQKVSDLSLFSVGADETWGTLNSIALTDGNAAGYTNTSSDEGIFFFENSMAGFVPAADNSFKYADITYVKVYGTYVPAAGEVSKLDDQGNIVAASAEEVAAERTEELDGQSYTWKAGSFFKGQNGKLYLTLAAARAEGNTTSELYDGGKMVWFTPANRQVNADGITVYPFTRRNNIYSLSIEAIKNIGDNFDPVDPDDPNITKPGNNPDEPVTPPNTPIDTHDTSIQVRAAILNWNVVYRGVTL